MEKIDAAFGTILLKKVIAMRIINSTFHIVVLIAAILTVAAVIITLPPCVQCL